VLVTPLTQHQRYGAKVFQITSHQYPVRDTAFHPFVDTLVATGDDNGVIKLTQIPAEGLTADISEAVATLIGHQTKINMIQFHPTANNILGSISADDTFKLWDVEGQREVSSVDLGSLGFHLDWNRNGSQAIVTTKSTGIKIFDPRDSKAVTSFNGFSGTKKTSALWADNHGLIVGVGSNKNSMRQLCVWDPKKLDAVLTTVELDSSPGTFVSYYDPDNSILWLGGKGDCSIKYYELVNTAPHLPYLSEFRDVNSQVGLAFLPKRAVDVKKCEIASVLRLMKDSVVPVSFQVPRKSDMFQKDLFPDTIAGVPSIEAKEYFDGKNADPVLVSMNPKGGGQQAAAQAAPAAFVAKKSPAEMQAEIDRLTARVAELEAQLAAKK